MEKKEKKIEDLYLSNDFVESQSEKLIEAFTQVSKVMLLSFGKNHKHSGNLDDLNISNYYDIDYFSEALDDCFFDIRVRCQALRSKISDFHEPVKHKSDQEMLDCIENIRISILKEKEDLVNGKIIIASEKAFYALHFRLAYMLKLLNDLHLYIDTKVFG